MDIYTLHFDGSCGPKNPGGTAAYGFLLRHGADTIERGDGVIGTGPTMSNNLAEFTALFHGLLAFRQHHEFGAAILNVRGDSQLVVNIMNRKWKPRDSRLYWPAYVETDRLVRDLRRGGVTVAFDWVPRVLNTEADQLSKNYVTVT